MWPWYFIFLVILLMIIVQFLSSKRNKPFPGLKEFLPQFNQETSEDLTPYYKNKSQMFVEKLTNTSIPYFETTLDLYEKSPETLMAEWTLGDNFKYYITKKYGQDFWDKCKPVLRLNHTNALPQPYYEDIPIELEEKKRQLTVNAPGETINCQIGALDEKEQFILFAQSNDVTIPQKNI